MRNDRGHILAAIAVLALLTGGCRDFPCVSEPSTHHLEPVPVEGDEVRYTYWDEEGIQHFVFDPAEVPPRGQHAVLIHISGETTPEMVGPIGWLADLTEPKPQARLRPMARARARAFASWSGGWAGDWVRVRAEAQAVRTERQQELEAQADARNDSPDDPPEEPAEPDNPLARLEADLAEEGIAMGEVNLQRATRSVASRRPLSRNFGIPIAIKPALLFAAEDCAPCERAIESVDDAHVLMVSDPSMAETLRKLSRLAGTQPGVPTLWRGDELYKGFDEETR